MNGPPGPTSRPTVWMGEEPTMSNLNLPKMTYGNLNQLVQSAYERGRTSVQLAYKTTAERVDDLPERFVLVRHHDSGIAIIGAQFIGLNNAGWDSVTTAGRLNQVLRDNQRPLQSGSHDTDRLYYSVGIRGGETWLLGTGLDRSQRKIVRLTAEEGVFFSRPRVTDDFVLMQPASNRLDG